MDITCSTYSFPHISPYERETACGDQYATGGGACHSATENFLSIPFCPDLRNPVERIGRQVRALRIAPAKIARLIADIGDNRKSLSGYFCAFRRFVIGRRWRRSSSRPHNKRRPTVISRLVQVGFSRFACCLAS